MKVTDEDVVVQVKAPIGPSSDSLTRKHRYARILA
jgi:hypothetical protein